MMRQNSLNINDIIFKCMNKYWEKGINSFSFNSIIYYSGVSKPTMYRLVGDEVTLKNKSLKLYYEKILKQSHFNIENATSLFHFISQTLNKIQNKKDGIANLENGLCYFQKTRIVKYTLDKKIKFTLNKMDEDFIKSYKILIEKLKSKNYIVKSVNTEFLAQFIYNSITFYVNTVQNSSSITEIDNMKKSILNTIKIYRK
ncbi:MAG: hypothetical protein CMP36_01565 [Rickettsiales bacterium]|nr:hypothetical protein [Rickettsiales bacterium]